MSLRIFSLLFLLLSSFHSSLSIAHDSNFATLQFVHTNSNTWVFEVKTPLYQLDQSMRLFSADKGEDLQALVVGSKQYKELIVDYIKSEFDVSVQLDSNKNAEPIKLSLGKGRIKLNDHMSELLFEIKDMPDNAQNVDFRLPYMSHNEAQHNVLRLINGEKNTRYILSHENQFSVIDKTFFISEAKAKGL